MTLWWWLMMIAPLVGATCVFAVGGDEPAAFTEEAVARGLVYEVRPFSALEPNTFGEGLAIVDLNGNGHQDVILMGHSSKMVGIFENDGTGHFIDRSFHLVDGQPVAKVVAPLASGIAAADFTGNGLKDVYITLAAEMGQMSQPNILLRNEGDFNFTIVSAEAGVGNTGFGHTAMWGDIDNDGWLDLYVVNYTLPSQAADPSFRNKLYRNLGDGTFADISVGSGVDDPGFGLSGVLADINHDGWLDLMVTNDKGMAYIPNRAWRNNQGQFEDICSTSGLCLEMWAMSSAAGDVTGNGYVDFYVTNLPHHAGYNGWNALHINQGDETFIEQCTEAAVCQFIFAWASFFFDFSNNGWQDLFVVNQTQEDHLFANHGQFPLINVGEATAIEGYPGVSYSSAYGDLTGNGALDIISCNQGNDGVAFNVQLFINHEGVKRNWVRFNVAGQDGNLHAIGANIQITAGGHTQWREVYAGGNNYKAQNELVFHFGLDEADHVDSILVNWPGGQVSRTLSNYPGNQTWTLYPPAMLGDANSDGVIDMSDLLALLSGWGELQSGSEIMDINGDGVIDVSDLLALLAMWGAN